MLAGRHLIIHYQRRNRELHEVGPTYKWLHLITNKVFARKLLVWVPHLSNIKEVPLYDHTCNDPFILREGIVKLVLSITKEVRMMILLSI